MACFSSVAAPACMSHESWVMLGASKKDLHDDQGTSHHDVLVVLGLAADGRDVELW